MPEFTTVTYLSWTGVYVPVNGDMIISIENGELTIVPASKKLKAKRYLGRCGIRGT